MLAVKDVIESLALISPALSEEHPLMAWVVKVTEGNFFSTTEWEWDEPTATAVLAIALENPEDKYSQVLALNMLIGLSESDFIDEDTRENHLKGSFKTLSDLANTVREPIIEYWIADTALSRQYRLRPPYAAELRMLAWRLGRRVDIAEPLLFEFYATRLLHNQSDAAIPLMEYEVSAKISLVNRLRTLFESGNEPVLTAIEMGCAADQAIYCADQGRREGVLYNRERVIEFLTSLRNEYPTFLSSGENPGLQDQFEYTPDVISKIQSSIAVVADALTLIQLPKSALELLNLAIKISPYEGSLNDLSLLHQLVDLCRSGASDID